MLRNIVGVLGVRLECNLGRAKRTFNVEPEDLDAIVGLSIDGLLSSIELLAFIDKLSAGITSPG